MENYNIAFENLEFKSQSTLTSDHDGITGIGFTLIYKYITYENFVFKTLTIKQ